MYPAAHVPSLAQKCPERKTVVDESQGAICLQVVSSEDDATGIERKGVPFKALVRFFGAPKVGEYDLLKYRNNDPR